MEPKIQNNFSLQLGVRAPKKSRIDSRFFGKEEPLRSEYRCEYSEHQTSAASGDEGAYSLKLF